MGTEKRPPRQFHIRVSDEAARAVTERSAAMGIPVADWLTRAVVHALEHGKANGEPKDLRLPWSILL